MARTSLFGALRRALATAHAMNTTGLSAQEVARRGPSRRDLLRGMGAVAALPLVPKLAGCGDNVVIPQPSIAIVGGGMAGLHCAYRLAQAGVTATVYEASDRVGGRMSTGRGLPSIQGGQLVEFGGEFIDTGHATMHALAEELAVPLDDLQAVTTGLRADTFFFNNNVVADMAIVNAFTPLAARMAASVTAAEADDAEFERVDAMTIPEWLQDEGMVGPNQMIHELLATAYTGEYGLDAAEQSIFNLLYLIDYDAPDPFRVFGDSDERYHAHGGNDAITTALAAALDPAQIVLGQRLASIARDGDQYVLGLADGAGGMTTATYDHVVLAIPFSTLRMVDLTMAGITADKQQIVDELGYGTNTKLMLQFATPTWRTAQMASGSSFTDVGELQSTWDTSRGQDGAQGILTNYVGGARGVAMAAGTAEDRAAEAVPWIDTVFPGAEAAYLAGSAVRSGWLDNPNARGSYACYRPGQWAFYGLEGERIGNLHFCGEHTSLDYQGYMEGAAETGALVAAELLDELGVEAPARLAQVLAPKLVLPQACYRAPALRLRRNQRRRGSAGTPVPARRVRARAP